MIRTLIVILWTLPATVVFGSLTILVSLFDRSGNLGHRFGGMWGRSILFAGRVRVAVKGLSRIDPFRSYIYMPNHQSNFDIPVLLGHLPVQFRWLAKAELFKIPIFGYAMKKAGYISIDRSKGRSAVKSLARAADAIRNGTSVVIFPEGTRSQDGRIMPFKQGGFIIGVDSGVPIVPVIIRGTREIMPKDRISIKSGEVTLEIKEPVESSGYTRKTRDVLMQKVRNIICDAFDKGEKDISSC
jgi:1-acyl-sn-glycerol-3-phosphate acyltransferase